jgi:hypothetical protein
MQSDRSSLTNQRLYGALRTALIGYGLGAYAFLVPAAAAQPRALLAGGVALQAVLIVVRRLVERYRNALGLDDELAARAVLTIELLADGVTVLLFALATFGGIAHVADVA